MTPSDIDSIAMLRRTMEKQVADVTVFAVRWESTAAGRRTRGRKIANGLEYIGERPSPTSYGRQRNNGGFNGL
jgi:hypothetical protein